MLLAQIAQMPTLQTYWAKILSKDKVKNNPESLQRGITWYLQQSQNQVDIRLLRINEEHSKTMKKSKFEGMSEIFDDMLCFKINVPYELLCILHLEDLLTVPSA